VTLEEMGIAPDHREGTTVRASATVRLGADTSAATTATLINLIRQADNMELTVDAATVSTTTKRLPLASSPSGHGPTHALLVISSATAYPKLR
jgi:hypothetical protein